MLRFRLGSITVVVHPVHFLVALVLGTYRIRYSPEVPQGVALAIWVVIVFVSVLFHELGHALAFRAFGYTSTVQLIALGGVTTPAIDRPLSWGKVVVSSLAGPTFGASLGLLCGVLAQATAPGSIENYALSTAALTNMFWAVFNLLPIVPLDGGGISRAILGKLFGRSGVIAAYVLGIVVCAGAAYFLYLIGGPYNLILVALFAWMNVQALMAAWRTEPDVPAPPQLVEAEGAFRKGELDRARSLASQLLDGELPVATRSRIHHLLGWVALKEGEGRRALDEFSQVQGRPVESQAVAAAFSLIGDDERAIPLWEQAARQSRDPTVLHEWAGALLRRGDVRGASAVPGVDLATAYERAERVAFLRGAYSEAARFGEESLARRPSAARAYEVACAYARAGDVRRAMALLIRARDLGYSDREAAASDPDLVPLAGEPAFQAWLASLEKSAAS